MYQRSCTAYPCHRTEQRTERVQYPILSSGENRQPDQKKITRAASQKTRVYDAYLHRLTPSPSHFFFLPLQKSHDLRMVVFFSLVRRLLVCGPPATTPGTPTAPAAAAAAVVAVQLGCMSVCRTLPPSLSLAPGALCLSCASRSVGVISSALFVRPLSLSLSLYTPQGGLQVERQSVNNPGAGHR